MDRNVIAADISLHPVTQVYRQRVSVKDDHWHISKTPDLVIVEEPLAIYLHWHESAKGDCQSLFSITMRTPGNDQQMVLGLLFAEGVIQHPSDIARMEYQDSALDTDAVQHNQLDVYFHRDKAPNHQLFQRQQVTNSSCGVCGKTTIKAIELSLNAELSKEPHWLPRQIIPNLPSLLRNKQTLFAETGGVHAVGLFDSAGSIICIQEDVGRHNALDKSIGFALASDINLSHSIAVLSGRISFELVQKCVMAGIPVIIAVGAPSSLAVKAAQQFNLTLIGFCGSNSMNIYHGDWRLKQ